MALTADRAEYTAAQINSVYEWIRDQVALKGPSQWVASRPGITAIADLQISDVPSDGPMQYFGFIIESPKDVVDVLQEQMSLIDSDLRLCVYPRTNSSYELTSLVLSFLSPQQTMIMPPRVIQSGPSVGLYDRSSNATAIAVDSEERLSIVLNVPTAGSTNYSMGSGMNTMCDLIGLTESFSDFHYTPLTTTIGLHETFDDWPTGRQFTQPTEPYQMLFSSSTLAAASLDAQITGSTDTFTVAAHKQGSLRVYWNGVRQTVGTEVIDNGTSITTTFTPQPGDALVIDYQPL